MRGGIYIEDVVGRNGMTTGMSRTSRLGENGSKAAACADEA